MDRIVIIGCSAGGKSTIARELSQILGIDVIHLLRHLREHGSHATIVQLRKPADVERWLDEVRRDARAERESHVARAG